jgi:VanZ family protein
VPYDSKRLPRTGYWLPAIVVACLIFTFSTSGFGDEQTGYIILPVLHWWLPWASPRTLHIMHTGIRKMAHVTEFGAFSVAVFHAVRAGRIGWKRNWAVATILIAGVWASLDELHQSFVPFRNATPRDVAIDLIGVSLAQVFVWWYATRKWPFAILSRT